MIKYDELLEQYITFDGENSDEENSNEENFDEKYFEHTSITNNIYIYNYIKYINFYIIFLCIYIYVYVASNALLTYKKNIKKQFIELFAFKTHLNQKR